MKMTDIQTITAWGVRRNWVIVKILRDTELVGWGEATLEGKERTCPRASTRMSW